MTGWGRSASAAAGALLLSSSLAAAGARTIEIAGFKFNAPDGTVHVGDTVTFVNKDVVPHTATRAGGWWDSGALAKGASWVLKADTAGTFDYACKFHPNMKAKLVVEP